MRTWVPAPSYSTPPPKGGVGKRDEYLTNRRRQWGLDLKGPLRGSGGFAWPLREENLAPDGGGYEPPVDANRPRSKKGKSPS